MSKHSSQEEYEKAKAKFKAMAQEKEKMIFRDLRTVRKTYTPKNVGGKLITACALFGAAYLTEELLFRKKVPGILKFTGALAATTLAPRVFHLVQRNFLIGSSAVPGDIIALLPEEEAQVESPAVNPDTAADTNP